LTTDYHRSFEALGMPSVPREDLSGVTAWKRRLAVAWVAQFLCLLGFDFCLPFIPFYIRELGVLDANQVKLWAGAIMSGVAIAMTLVSPLWGWLADRRGPKLMVERAAFGGAITLAAMAFVTNVQQLFVLRVLQGALTGFTLAFIILVSSFVPPSSVGFSLGLMQMGGYLAFSFGPLIGGVLADYLGYRQAFAAAALILVIGGLLVLVLLVEDKPSRTGKTKTNRSMRECARTIAHSGPILAAMLALSAVYAANSASRPILPLFVESLLPNPTLVNISTGITYGVLSFASAISAALLGWLGDRIGYRKILLVCGAGAALTYVGQALSPNLPVLLATTFATGVCVGGLLPTANAILAHTAPKEQQGTVYALSHSFSSGGRVVGPMLGATVAATWGLRSAFATTGALFALTTVWALLTARPKEENLAKGTIGPSG